MGRRNNLSCAASTLFVLLLVAFIGDVKKVTSLEISQFPHYQTFDSWNDCYYDGTCYELYCDSLKGGWVNPEFHSDVSPYTQEVRSWWTISGPTASNIDANGNAVPCSSVITGPCYDHTGGGTVNGTKYLYAESSGCFGYYFRVNTPTMIFTAANASFSFHYYMFGSTMDVINPGGGVDAYLRALMTLDNGTNWIELFRHDRDSQQSSTEPWDEFSTILDSHFPAVPTPSAPIVANFQFEARTGGQQGETNDWKSDIAIDDVLWTQAGASSVLDPYIDPIPTNGTDPTGTGDGGGISDGEIAGIVVGVVGGLGALCCCLLLLILLMLLAISPRGPKKGAAPPMEDGDGL